MTVIQKIKGGRFGTQCISEIKFIWFDLGCRVAQLVKCLVIQMAQVPEVQVQIQVKTRISEKIPRITWDATTLA